MSAPVRTLLVASLLSALLLSVPLAAHAQTPLQERRTGVSTGEPNYCTTTLERDAPNASATKANSIEAGPPLFQVDELEPGTTYGHCFYILNRKTTQRTFQLQTIDVVGSLDSRVRLEVEDPEIVGAWIKLERASVTLAPGERIRVPYTLVVPDQVPAGTVTGGIRIVDVTDSEAAAGANVRGSLVLQVQATFPGGKSARLQLVNVDAQRVLWRGRDAPRVHVSFDVANRSDIAEIVNPRLRVGGLFGSDIADVRVGQDVVAPQSSQRMRATWSDVPWIGWYRPSVEVQSSAGSTSVQLPAVWIIPPWPVLAAFVIAVGLAVFAVVRRRRAAWVAYLDDEDVDE